MFPAGLYIDGDWISNGEWMQQVPKVHQREFINQLLKEREDAVRVWVKCKSLMFLEQHDCILLGNESGLHPVRIELLEAIGVHMEVLDEYYFWLHPETKSIYVYNPDLIGIVKPMRPHIQKNEE